MSVRDVQELLLGYVRNGDESFLISKLTEKILSKVEEWQSRPLEKIYVIFTVVKLGKKWSRSSVRNWGIIYGQLSEIFGEGLEA